MELVYLQPVASANLCQQTDATKRTGKPATSLLQRDSKSTSPPDKSLNIKAPPHLLKLPSMAACPLLRLAEAGML